MSSTPRMKTFKAGNLEVLAEDLDEMNFSRTEEACRALGQGWRLPTFEEYHLLQCLYELGVGEFDKRGIYWASDPVSPGKPEGSYLKTWSFTELDHDDVSRYIFHWGEPKHRLNEFLSRPVRDI